MNFLEALANFKSWAIEVIPKLIKKNRELREEIRSIVGELADEIMTGLNLVVRRLRVSKRLHEPDELASYLSDSERQLHDTFKEFHVCRGLRDLEDRFNRFFDLTDKAVEIGARKEVSALISNLEDHEQLVFNMVNESWNEINKELDKPSVDVAKLHKKVDQAIKECEAQIKQVRDLTREIIDKV